MSLLTHYPLPPSFFLAPYLFLSSSSLILPCLFHTTAWLPLVLDFSLLFCLLSSTNSPPLISHCPSPFPTSLFSPLPPLTLPCSLTSLDGHNTEEAVHLLAGFVSPLPDNSPVLTGWSYYPLYEMSMLRGLYEILVPVDKMMELVSAVIPQLYNGISWEIHNAMDY